MPTLGEAIASPSSRPGGRRFRLRGGGRLALGDARARRFSGRRGRGGGEPREGAVEPFGPGGRVVEPDVADAADAGLDSLDTARTRSGGRSASRGTSACRARSGSRLPWA